MPLCSGPAVFLEPQMNAASVTLLALAMSTDAFAAAIGKGSALVKPRWSEAVRTGLIFGVIEAITPLVGWALGYAAADYVKSWDHWIAFVLLLVLGLRMVVGAFQNADAPEISKPARHGFWLLVTTGFATSITVVALSIGFATFAMVTLGVMVGRLLGHITGRWAEAVGGLVLIAIGSLILYEHLSVV